MNGVKWTAVDTDLGCSEPYFVHFYLLFRKVRYQSKSVLFGCFEVVVDNDMVEVWCERKFVFSFCDALFDNLLPIGSNVHWVFFSVLLSREVVQRCLWLDCRRIALCCIRLSHLRQKRRSLHVQSAPQLQTLVCHRSGFHKLLRIQGTRCLQSFPWMLWAKERSILRHLLRSPRLTTCTRDWKVEIKFRMFFHQPLHNGALSRARWCTED